MATPVRGATWSEHPRDVRMIHHGQRLPLGFKALDHGLGIHPRFDEF
jgi:hypothetical protein